MTANPLVGMFFMQDNGDRYSTGEIVAEVGAGVYLVRFDGQEVTLPMELVSFPELLEIKSDGLKAWTLFNTREELQAWDDWLNTPSKPKVVSIVGKKN